MQLLKSQLEIHTINVCAFYKISEQIYYFFMFL